MIQCSAIPKSQAVFGSVSMLHISGCFLFVFLSDTMAFDLERNPILQPLNKSKKVDLMLIANLFAVQVPLNAKKKKKKIS